MESIETNTTVSRTLSKMSSWIEDPGVEEFNGLNMTRLKMDQAYITVASDVGDVGVYTLRDDCYRCPFELVHRTVSSEDTLVVDTTRGFTWRVYQNVSEPYIPYRNKSGLLCEVRPAAGQFGVYRLDASACDMETLRQPVNIYLPLLMLVLVLTAMGLLYSAGSLLVSYFQKKGKLRYAEKELSTKLRIRSLDTFRGLTIITMIFANDGAGGYWFLEHATWNGLALADLVFPFFLWIMGVCIPISIKSTFTKGVPRYKTLFNIFRRSCILFLLGLALNTLFGGARLDTLRVPGVLQRFAITYFFAATIYLYTTKKYHTYPRSSFGLVFKDIYVLLPQWILHLLIVALHTTIIFKVAKPGCPAGYMGPGGKHDNWAYENCTGGATAYVDELILGNNHIFQNAAIRAVYAALPLDPEGILGCLTSLFQVFLGIQAGCTLQHFKKWRQRVVRWMIWAVILALVGGVLCGFSREIGVIPVNKQLWSLSYTLITSSFAFTLLTICYLLVDVVGVWSGAPCLHAGMNAILLYVGHMLCWSILPFHWAVPNMRTHFMKLFENVWGTALWVALAIFLARKKIFLTV